MIFLKIAKFVRYLLRVPSTYGRNNKVSASFRRLRWKFERVNFMNSVIIIAGVKIQKWRKSSLKLYRSQKKLK